MLFSSPRAYIGPAQHLTPQRPSAGTFPMDDSLESVIRAFTAYHTSVLFVGLTLENAVFLGFIVPGITILGCGPVQRRIHADRIPDRKVRIGSGGVLSAGEPWQDLHFLSHWRSGRSTWPS